MKRQHKTSRAEQTPAGSSIDKLFMRTAANQQSPSLVVDYVSEVHTLVLGSFRVNSTGVSCSQLYRAQMSCLVQFFKLLDVIVCFGNPPLLAGSKEGVPCHTFRTLKFWLWTMTMPSGTVLPWCCNRRDMTSVLQRKALTPFCN